MPLYLVDINLPCYISEWQKPDFMAQADINRTWSDEKIWEYARINNLTIITKDADFQDRILFNDPPPKVIWIRFGNMRLKDFVRFLEINWLQIKQLSDSNKFVMVFSDRIEAID